MTDNLFDKISDARSLLELLRKLVGELAKNEKRPGVPWHGMQLTLEQSIELIASALGEADQRPAPDEDDAAQALRASPLAARLRRVKG